MQYSGEDVISDHIDFYDMHYPIAERGAVDDYTGTVLPEMLLFNHKGELILHKRIFDHQARQVILDALEAAPHPLLGDKQYLGLAEEADRVKRGEELGAVLAKARRIWTAETFEEAGAATEIQALLDEAFELFSRLDNHAELLIYRAELAAEKNPVLGCRMYRAAYETFKGDLRGAEAKAAMDAIAGERSFPRELTAWRLWERVEPIYRKHRLRITEKNRAILEVVDKLCADYPDTTAGVLAADLKAPLAEAMKNRNAEQGRSP